jgi:protease-4
MLDVAASGGYQIAFRATHLMAGPLSVVGSIGSISAFFDLSGFYERIGLGKDGVEVGPLAGLGRTDRAPTAAEWAAFTAAHEADFEAWLRDVADRRGLTFEQAEQLAYGRIFTGDEAVANGLIDGLGDLDDAVREAAALAGVAPEAALQVVHLPRPVGLVDQLLGRGDGPDTPVVDLVRWAAYRQLRRDVDTTVDLLVTETALTGARP